MRDSPYIPPDEEEETAKPVSSFLEDTSNKSISDLTPEEKDFLSNYLDVNLAYNKTYQSFYEFTEKIFSRAMINSVGDWKSGDYVKRSCNFLQNNKHTMYLGPRQHFKSVRFYAYIMWVIWKNIKDNKNIRINYFSFNQDLAEMHVKNIKDFIKKSIFAQYGLIDLQAQAKTSASYTWDKNVSVDKQKTVSISSSGIMGGVRGIHCEYLFVDDPYRDDRNQNTAVEPLTVSTINSIFDKSIFPMPVQGGEFHVIGTPQSKGDIFFQERYKRFFRTREEPVCKIVFNEETKEDEEVALWPEMFPMRVSPEEESQGMLSIEILRATIPAPEFNQEYMCRPRTSSDSYFESERIQKSIDLGHEKDLVNWDFSKFEIKDLYNKTKPKFGFSVYAAYDPGKKRHPGHFVVMQKEGDTLVQLLSKWFDGWDYAYTVPEKPSQFSYIQEAIKFFGVRYGWMDNTNGVLSTAVEQKLFPGFKDIHISHTARGGYASALEQVLGTNQFLLVDDPRQARALLGVLSNLTMIEEKDHHAEPFTTLGMLASYVLKRQPTLFQRVTKLRIDKNNIAKMYRGFF
jgi:hypothetical protein